MKEHSNAYMQLATLQTKLDEDDYILSMLQSHTFDGCDSSDDCDDHRNDLHNSENCDAELEKVVARRKSLNRELRKVKKRICEIEGMWRG
jgi:hypothetical protein